MTEIPDDYLAEADETHPTRFHTLRELFARTGTRLNPKLDTTNEFPMSQEELISKLQTEDPDFAADILVEAREIASAMVGERIESVERRATTLQGVVAVAATFTLAGGSLLVTQIHGLVWQLGLGCGLLWVSTRFVLSGLRATQATSTVHKHRTPPRDRILNRAAQPLAIARIDRAAYDLRVAGSNSSIARWKVTMLGKARRHLLWALFAVPLLTLLMIAYAAFGAPSPHQGRAESGEPSKLAGSPADATRSTPPDSGPASAGPDMRRSSLGRARYAPSDRPRPR